jgi:hypothetical protein
MFITALCPTFRHPELLANSLELWNRQTYPADQRRLLILDDGDTFDNQIGPNWTLMSTKSRFASLPLKYNTLLSLGLRGSDAILVWEDDDIYLPTYIEEHAKVLANHEFSKPNRVLTDCGPDNSIQEEPSGGRFHSTMGFQHSLIKRIGGWINTKRADFDLQLVDKLTKSATSFGQWEDVSPIPFIYCWHTGQAHCQWTMKSPDDETWYDRGNEAYKPVPRVGELTPKLDERTTKILEKLGI